MAADIRAVLEHAAARPTAELDMRGIRDQARSSKKTRVLMMGGLGLVLSGAALASAVIVFSETRDDRSRPAGSPDEAVSPAPSDAAPPPDCGAGDLTLQPRWGAATGSYGGTWLFANNSAEPCLLRRELRALLLDDRGRILVDSGFDPTSGPQRVVLDSGERASIVLLWSNWCGSYEGPFRVKIVLPRDNGEFIRDLRGSASCITKRAGTNFSLSNFGRAAPAPSAIGRSATPRETGDCPVTVPQTNFVPPPPYPPEPGLASAWYGTPELWTVLDHSGAVWTDLPVAEDGHVGDKTLWFSENFSTAEGEDFSGDADITITAVHLDGSAPTVVEKGGGPSFNRHTKNFMLVGLEVPKPGCWEVTARYQGAELSYVLLVED